MATTHDTQGMSQAELDLLEEIGEDGVPKETPDEIANREALAKPVTGEEGDGTDPADVAAAPAAAPAVAAAPAPAADTTVVDPPEGTPTTAEPTTTTAVEPTPFVPQYTAEVPADAQEQIQTLTKEVDDAFDKLMEGELDKDQYRAIKTRVEAAVDDLKTKALTASIFEQANQQNAMQAAQAEWTRSEAKIFTDAKAEGLDYKGKPALLAAFNHNLKALGNDPANENRDAPWFLTEAHKRTKADLGITGAAPAPAPAAPTPPAPKPKGVDLSQVPPTLGRVPPAADPTVAGDEFAHLSTLTGGDLEKAVAKMTPEQQERWLN